jgi:hypothetical protein
MREASLEHPQRGNVPFGIGMVERGVTRDPDLLDAAESGMHEDDASG